MSTPEVKIGIVGWGGRGGHVASEAFGATGGKMVPAACVEPSDEKYEYGRKCWGHAPPRYESVADMLAGQKLDAVIVGTPNALHLQNLRELSEFGKPILVEKPLDSTFEKICDVVRFARAYPAPILVGHCMRFAPIAQEARRMLQSGAIGQACSFRFVQNCHYGNMGYHNWRRNRELGGTWLIEKATHDLDILHWLLGDVPVSVAAVQKQQAFGGDKPAELQCRNCPERADCPESITNVRIRSGDFLTQEQSRTDDLCVFSVEADNPDNDVCLIQMAGGTFGTYHEWYFSPRSYNHRIYELHGTEGAMEMDLGAEHGGCITLCKRYGNPADRLRYEFDYLGRNHYNGDAYMTQHFYKMITEDAPSLATVEQAFVAELLGYGGILSAEQQQFIALPGLLPDDLKDIYEKGVF